MLLPLPSNRSVIQPPTEGRCRHRAKTWIGFIIPGTIAKYLLHKINAYWCAPNHLSVGQIHLYDHSLLRQPGTSERIRPLEIGHWRTTRGQNIISVHLKRIIKNRDPDMFEIAVLATAARPSLRTLEGRWPDNMESDPAFT